jgi:hypothetical protein
MKWNKNRTGMVILLASFLIMLLADYAKWTENPAFAPVKTFFKHVPALPVSLILVVAAGYLWNNKPSKNRSKQL